MTGSWAPQEHPNLTDDNSRDASLPSNRYNCIAWAAGNDTRWWWPDRFSYWPAGVRRERKLDAFVQAYETLGYIECADVSLEIGFQKVVIYAKREGGELLPTHAALQLPDGRWTSKMGPCEDIEHDTLNALEDPTYGSAVRFLKKAL